jgi:hypothetical protein
MVTIPIMARVVIVVRMIVSVVAVAMVIIGVFTINTNGDASRRWRTHDATRCSEQYND